MIEPRRDDVTERLAVYVRFWVIAGFALLIFGIATFTALHHGHRVGFALGALAAPCFAAAWLVRRAQRGPE